MTRLVTLLLLGGAGVLVTPATAPAQFGPGGFSPPVPVIVPSFNPWFYVPQYRYNYSTQYNFNVLGGNFRYSSFRSGVSVSNPYAVAGAQAFYQSLPYYGQGGSYLSGGVNTRNDLALTIQRNLERAQREASLPGSRSTSSAQVGPDRGPAGPGAVPAPAPVPVFPNGLANAIAVKDPALIASGDPLNEILKEIIRVESKGAKGPSGFVPPLLLDDVRFAGPPAADLLNLARRAGNLEFPAAFDDPALAALRPDLAKDFAAVAVAVQAGKSPDGAKLAKLEATFQRMQDAAGPVVKNLPFEDATAATRFLNRMASAIKALKGGAGNGLIDPKWTAEGLTVGDLVKHMTKHKLQFGPAPRGRDESYATMHRNLATYLLVLTQPKK